MTAGKWMGVLGALALVATPAIAHAADASKLSLTPAATAAMQDGESGSGPGILGAAIGIGVIAILVLGLTVGDDNEDDLPSSP